MGNDTKKTFLAAVVFFAVQQSQAQPLALPVLPDNFLFSTPAAPPISNVNKMNASLINYLDQYGVEQQLFAVIECGNSNPGGIHVHDQASGFQVDIPYPSATPIDYPDIIIGNDPTFPLTDYNIAASHDGTIDFYNVHYTSPTSFAVTYLSTTVVTGIGPATNIHLDIVAEQYNTGPTGLPYCGNFAITWVDGFGNVYVDEASIAAPPPVFPSASTILLTGPGSLYPLGKEADIAGVQQYEFGPLGGPIHDYGLVTYVDYAMGDKLYYAKIDFTTSTLPPYVTATNMLDPGGVMTPSISIPRIDAPDLVMFSGMWSPLPPFDAEFKVVADVRTIAGTDQVNIYDNNGAMPLPLLVPAATGNQIVPTVAFNMPAMTYEVQQYIVNGTYPELGDIFMEPMQWAPPMMLAPPGAYFRINTNTPLDITYCGGGPNAIANSPNDPERFGGGVLSVWACKDATGLVYDGYYKFTQPSPMGYGYRTGAATNDSGNVGTIGWTAFPNPTQGDFEITNGSIKADRYRLADVAGIVVATGVVSDNGTTVHTSGLPAGTYRLTLFKKDKSLGTQSITIIR